MRTRILALASVLVGMFLVMPGGGSAVGAGAGSSGSGSEASGDGERVKFVILQTDPEATENPMVAFGAIHDQGTDVVVSGKLDRFEFDAGSLLIRHHRVGQPGGHFDEQNCYGTFTERGRWKVEESSGDFDGVSGGGRYRVRGQLIGCEEPEVFQVKIVAKGSLEIH